MSTLIEVAKRAGVSAMTVSRFFNQPDALTPATRERVRQAVEESHFVPNAAARSLVRGSTNLVALILADVTNPFFMTLARGVEDAAQNAAYTLMLGNTDESLEKERRYLDVISSRRVDGVILSSAPGNDHHLELLQRRKIPVVLIDRKLEEAEIDVVRGDTYNGGKNLVRHLVEQGYREIAFVGGFPGVSSLEDRLAGYTEAMKDAGLQPRSHLGRFDRASGEEIAEALIQEDQLPEAIVAANNLVAIGVMISLQRHGIEIPDRVALACFEDIGMASLVWPFLTVVEQPAYEMGKVAMEVLQDRMQGKNAHVIERVLPTKLIIRRSTLRCGAG